MRRPPRLSFGVDISQTQINLAVLAKDEKGVRLVKGLQFPLPTGIVEKGTIKDPETLLEILKQLKKDHTLPGVATLGLIEGMAIHHILELPKRLPANINDFVKAEFKQCVAISVEAMVSDYGRIASSGEGHHRLLAVAADQSRIAELINLCRHAQVKAMDVEPPMLAMMRALYPSRVANHVDKNVLMVWCRDDTVHVCVFRHGQLDFIRVRNLQDLRSHPETLCQVMIDELNATMQYYSVVILDTPLMWQVTILSDATWSWPENAVAILKEGLPPAEVEFLYENEIRNLGVEVPNAETATSVVAIGLAQRGLETSEHLPKLRLLPSRIVQIRDLQRQAVLASVVTLLGGVLMALVVLSLSWHANHTRQYIAAYMAHHDVNEAVALMDAHKRIEKQIEDLSLNYKVVDKLLQMHPDFSWAPLLGDIGKMTNDKLKIKRLEQPRDGSYVILEGESLNREEVNRFVERLGHSEQILDAQVIKRDQLRKDSNLIVAYQIKCQLVSPTGGQP